VSKDMNPISVIA